MFVSLHLGLTVYTYKEGTTFPVRFNTRKFLNHPSSYETKYILSPLFPDIPYAGGYQALVCRPNLAILCMTPSVKNNFEFFKWLNKKINNSNFVTCENYIKFKFLVPTNSFIRKNMFVLLHCVVTAFSQLWLSWTIAIETINVWPLREKFSYPLV